MCACVCETVLGLCCARAFSGSFRVCVCVRVFVRLFWVFAVHGLSLVPLGCVCVCVCVTWVFVVHRLSLVPLGCVYVCVCVCGCSGSLLCTGFLWVQWVGITLMAVHGFSSLWLLLLGSMASRVQVQ